MATRARVDQFAQANRTIRDLVRRDLRAFWALLPADPPQASLAVVEFLPTLTTTYGDISATVAAEFFEEMRFDAGMPGRFHARLAPVAPIEAVQINARWAVRPMMEGDLAGALGRLDQVADRMSLQPGRDTIDASTKADPAKPRWARVPTGATTCAFCLVLASRGAVYGTAETAGGAGNTFHADCDCTPTPIWPNGTLPDGYEPQALRGRYQAARNAAGSGDPNAILAELRKLDGIH